MDASLDVNLDLAVIGVSVFLAVEGFDVALTIGVTVIDNPSLSIFAGWPLSICVCGCSCQLLPFS